MDIARYIFAILLGILGLIITLANWSAVIKYIKNKNKEFSLVPLLGGVLLCIAFAIFPNNPYIYLCWIGLIIDTGCLPMVIRALIHTIKIKHKRD